MGQIIRKRNLLFLCMYYNILSSHMPYNASDNKADHKRSNPTESDCRQRHGGNDGFCCFQTAKSGQRFYKCIGCNGISSSFIGFIMRNKRSECSQYHKCQNRRIADSENPTDIFDNTVHTEKRGQCRKVYRS